MARRNALPAGLLALVSLLSACAGHGRAQTTAHVGRPAEVARIRLAAGPDGYPSPITGRRLAGVQASLIFDTLVWKDSTGAGKSTLAALLVGLLPPDQGAVWLGSRNLATIGPAEWRRARRQIQLLFQDPFEALSPRLTIGAAVREPLDVQKVRDPAWRDERVRLELSAVRLPTDPSFLARRSHELSGGQLQRVVLARALVLDPELLVADEPVSMLDPSEQANLLQLLKRLQVERGMAMVLVSHDLAVVLRTADRILVVDRGRVVEEGTGTELLISPQHPVTQALLAAAGRDRLFAGFTASFVP